MKNVTYSLILACISGVSINAMAADHTVSVGYAQIKADDFKNLKGVNLQYRYENQSPWGATVSTTFASAKEDTYYNSDEKEHAKVSYYSLLAGPTYRLNEYVSFYALAGFANTKTSYDHNNYAYNYSEHTSMKKTSFAYGAGAVVNPMENLSVYLGYEGTEFKGYENQTAKLNGFNIGVGYKF